MTQHLQAVGEAIQPKITTYDGHVIELVVQSRGQYDKMPAIVLTHGIFTDRDEKGRFIRLSERLQDAGFTVVRFNFRGHGNSPLSSKAFSVTGAIVDYLAVLRWISNSFRAPFAVVGSSFGGSIVMLERLSPMPVSFHNIVLLNPVVDYIRTFIHAELSWGKEIFSPTAQSEILTKGFSEVQPGFDASLSLLLEMSTIEPWRAAKYMGAPTQVFHGDNDDKVPYQPTQQYFSALSNVRVDIVRGAGHAFKTPDTEQYVHSHLTESLVRALKESQRET